MGIQILQECTQLSRVIYSGSRINFKHEEKYTVAIMNAQSAAFFKKITCKLKVNHASVSLFDNKTIPIPCI